MYTSHKITYEYTLIIGCPRISSMQIFASLELKLLFLTLLKFIITVMLE